MKITNLKTENRRNPIGIDMPSPAFSWNVKTEQSNWKQKSYQILVNRKEDHYCMWDSGRVFSDQMVNIPYQGTPLESACEYIWTVSVSDQSSEAVTISEAQSFETGFLDPSCWRGIWLGEQLHCHHMFRRTFKLKEDLTKARLYICGLGHYKAYLNGSACSEYVLEPGWTDYDKSCLYTVTDVTKLLHAGENAVGILPGDGMYYVPGKVGRYAYFAGKKRMYGKSRFLFQLEVTYHDGEIQRVLSDREFHMAPSPITFSCIYGGEEYDARLEQDHFSCPDFKEDDSWSPASEQKKPKGRLCAQCMPPLKVMQRYRPVSITQGKDGVWLYDLGKNFSGWVSVRILAKRNAEGSVVRMRPGELLGKDGLPDQRVTGENYSWDYTMNWKAVQDYTPSFTYTGFRYVEVTGAVPKEMAGEEDEIVLESLFGEFIYPDMEKTGEFHCSNPLYNEIHELILQAIRSNLKSILTDCPHREKLGWLEQTHLIGPAVMYNYDVHNLYRKIEQDMYEGQHADGLVPDICPEYIKEFSQYHTGFEDSPEWGSACVINPWLIYQRYGDDTLLREYYPLMKSYVAYLTSKTRHGLLHHGLGDWLDEGPMKPFSQNTPVPVVASAVYYYDLVIMQRAAGLVGNREDELYFASQAEYVKKEFTAQYFDTQTGRFANGSQTAQAMALAVGLVPEEKKKEVLDYLVKDITSRCYAVTAGDIGHPFLIRTLTENYRSDVIDAMMQVTDAPGYGYQVCCGATTLTEEWDGPAPGREHGSQNHLMLGSGEEWFYRGLAGISMSISGESINKIIISPFTEGCVTEVDAWHRHPYGIVSVHWKKESGMLLIEGEIPPNTEAEIVLNECKAVWQVGSGRYFLFDTLTNYTNEKTGGTA